MAKSNVLSGKLDAQALEKDGAKLISVSKNKDVYIFDYNGLLEKLFQLSNNLITEVELRFNKEAYSDANLAYDSSIKDAIRSCIPKKAELKEVKYFTTGVDSPVTRVDTYEYDGSPIAVRYLEEILDDWINVSVTWVWKK